MKCFCCQQGFHKKCSILTMFLIKEVKELLVILEETNAYKRVVWHQMVATVEFDVSAPTIPPTVVIHIELDFLCQLNCQKNLIIK